MVMWRGGWEQQMKCGRRVQLGRDFQMVAMGSVDWIPLDERWYWLVRMV
jgi:hypothetical protein